MSENGNDVLLYKKPGSDSGWSGPSATLVAHHTREHCACYGVTGNSQIVQWWECRNVNNVRFLGHHRCTIYIFICSAYFKTWMYTENARGEHSTSADLSLLTFSFGCKCQNSWNPKKSTLHSISSLLIIFFSHYIEHSTVHRRAYCCGSEGVALWKVTHHGMFFRRSFPVWTKF